MKKYLFSILALTIAICCSSYTIKRATYYYYVIGTDDLNQYYFVREDASPYCGTGSTYPCLIVSDVEAETYEGQPAPAVPQLETVVISRALWYP